MRRLDLGLDVARQVLERPGFHLQLQLSRFHVGADRRYLADLHAAQLHFGAGFHHQSGPVRHQRQRDVSAKCAGERGGGQRDQTSDQDEQRWRPPDRVDLAPAGPIDPTARFVPAGYLGHGVTPTG